MKQVRIKKRIIDYGVDHHSAHVLARPGEILYLHKLFDEGALLSHSNDPAKQQFYAEADEFKVIEGGDV